MNSEYGQNVSQQKSLQELKQMNQPNSKEPTQSTSMTPIVIQCPLPQAIIKLTQQARDQLGAGEYSPNTPQSENAYRPDRNAESTGENRQPTGTGWEEEREAYLQMAEVAAGLRLPDAGQVAGAAVDSGGGGTGGVVWRGADHQQYPQSVSLTPGLRAGLSGLAAAGALLDDDSEDAEEKRRRMEAKMEGENVGVLLGLAAGAAIALAQKEEQPTQQEDNQQTML